MTTADLAALVAAVVTQGETGPAQRAAWGQLADALADCGQAEAEAMLRRGYVGGVRVLLPEQCEVGPLHEMPPGRPGNAWCGRPATEFKVVGDDEIVAVCEYHGSMVADYYARVCDNCSCVT
jgi:hypothetical protein